MECDGLIQGVCSASSHRNFCEKQTKFKYLYTPFNCKITCENFSDSHFYSLFDCEEALRNISALQIQWNKNIHSYSVRCGNTKLWDFKVEIQLVRKAKFTGKAVKHACLS